MNQPNTFHRSLLATALGLAFASAAQAQATAPRPDIGEALRQAQPPAVPAPAQPPLPNIGGTTLEAPMQVLPGGGPSIAVQRFAVTGNRAIDSASLLALVAPDQGKTLTLAQLEAIASKLTQYYRSAGYFVARAYLPQQEVKDGVLLLRIVEGNYGRFVLDNKSRVRDDVVQGLLDDIKDRDIVSLDTLERAMLIINDTPGVQVTRADVMPGEKVGTSDFAVGTEATPAYNGFVMLDNHGSVYTGKERLSFNADWNSPTGRGDRLSASGLVTRGADLVNGRLGYSTLVATNGTRAEAAVSQTNYALGDTYAALDAIGRARSFELNLTTPIKRTRARSIEAGVGIAYRDLLDEVRSTGTRTPKTTTSVNASLSGRADHALFGLDGQTSGSAVLTVGRLSIDDATARALDAVGAQTHGGYAKLNASAARAMLLPAALTLSTSLRGQVVLNDKSLDGSERISVSGAGGVAAYPSGELSGDNGLLAHIELSRPLPSAGSVRLTASAFGDYGYVKQNKALVGNGRRELSDFGLGFSATAAGALLRVQIAHRVGGGDPVSEPAPKTRVLVQGGWVF